MEDALPRLARELLEEWDLASDGESRHGRTALVVPVLTEGRPSMLKIGARPHEPGREAAEHEALALQRWGGRGAVRLLRADPHRRALLLERLGPADLTEHWDVAACEIVAGLYASLHIPAPPQLSRLSEQASRWADELGAVQDLPVPRRMVEHARALARDFAADPATDGTMIHTDLHYQQVLMRSGDEYVAIAPKPLSGDPHYEIAPMLWHRYDEYAGRFRDAVRDRFFALVDGAGLAEERARDWVIVRLLVKVVGELEYAAPDRDWITAMLSIAKAVQD